MTFNSFLEKRVTLFSVPKRLISFVDVVAPPVAQPAAQDTENNNTAFIIGAIVGSLVLLAVVILLLVFLCRKKKSAEQETYNGAAFTNETYGDLEGQGQGARASVVEYDDTDVIKKKLPIDDVGAVGHVNPSYVEEKKALEAAGGMGALATPNVYEEIPDVTNRKARPRGNPVVDSNDGYESPISGAITKTALPGLVDEMNMDNPTYKQGGNGNGARPKVVTTPPAYSEIPTPAEVEADPRPPTYTNLGREPVRFKDFQEVKYANVDDDNDDVQNHHVDIKDIKVKDKN